MKTRSFLFVMLILSAKFCTAQTVDNAVNKVDNTIYQVNKANETFGKLKGLIPKKKNKTPPASDSTKSVVKNTDSSKTLQNVANVTVLKITGIDYATLKKLYANIQACDGVQEAKMKFGADSSSVEIRHTGTTETVFNLIQLTSSDIITDNNIVGIEEGKVTLKLK